MADKHQWVTFSKGRMQVTGCARCGEVLLPTNEVSDCNHEEKKSNMLLQRGFEITGRVSDSQVA